MKLSNAFLEQQKDPQCELKVKFTKIRGNEYENLNVVQKCDILKQYCEFMEIVFRCQSEIQKQPTTEEMQGCYEKAIHEANSKGILVDYLTRKSTEVMNMFIGEYDYDLDVKVKAEEAAEELALEIAEKKAVEIAEKLAEKKAVEIAEKKAVELAEKKAEKLIEKKAENASNQKAIEIATNMLSKNYPVADISELTGLDVEQINKLQTEKNR